MKNSNQQEGPKHQNEAHKNNNDKAPQAKSAAGTKGKEQEKEAPKKQAEKHSTSKK